MVAAKIAEFHFFETGLVDRQLELMRKAAAANPEVSHVLAMHAFALELNAERERADEVAQAALAIDPDTMWAQHCRAHVFAGQSRIAEGIAAMEAIRAVMATSSAITPSRTIGSIWRLCI